jgi:hypothetical protein
MSSALRLGSAFLAVVGTAAFAAYVVIAANFRSGWNLLSMVSLPLVAIVVSIRRMSPWVWPAAFAWLAICWICALAIAAQLLGAG